MGTLSNYKHGVFYIRYFENGPLEPGIKRRAYKQERGENCFFAHETQFLLTPSLFASLTFLLFPSPDATVTFLMRNLSTDDGDVNENGKQATGLDWQNNNSARDHAFCTFLCRHCTTTT